MQIWKRRTFALEYLGNYLKISFDQVANIYDKTRELPPNIMKQVIEAFAREIEGYKTVLDLGVGTGRFAKPLQEQGFRIIGIDISREMLRKAQDKRTDNLLLGEACQLPFKDSAFQIALCIHILHLISDWKVALGEICRVTTEELASITHTRMNPISEAYEKMLRKRGYDLRRLGIGESELQNLAKPVKSIFIASHEYGVNKRLDYLRQRASSRQWRIPEEVNKQVVQELTKRFVGQKYSQDINLLVWNINDLKVYLKQ